MSTITTRAGKGSELTWAELDANFTALNTDKLQLDASGNLGVGTSSPGAKLDVNGLITTSTLRASGGIAAVSGVSSYLIGNTASAGGFRLAAGLNVTFDGTNWRTGTDGGSNGGAAILSAYGSGNLEFHTVANNGTTGQTISNASMVAKMTLDASGRLGIGTSSPVDRLTVAGTTASNPGLTTVSDDGNYIPQFTQYKWSGTGSNFYASRIASTGLGGFAFLVAPTATIGAHSFTQAMTLDASGNLLVGTASTISGFSGCKLTVVSGAGSYLQVTGGAASTNYAHNTATTGDNSFLTFGTEAAFTTRGSIDYNRAGGLVRYNTTSDYRAKDIIGPVQNPGATIDALKVYEGVMKGATQSRPMLIAHEAQEAAPYAVSGVKDEMNEDGTPKYQQIDVSSLVPLLLAEIQSLRKRLAALEAQ